MWAWLKSYGKSVALRYRQAPGSDWRLVDESAVVLDQTEGELMRFDEVGTRIWQALEEARTTHEIAEHLSLEFDAPLAVLRRDVARFLKRLERMELVEMVNDD